MKYILIFLLSFNAFAQDTIIAEPTLKVNPDNARIVIRIENTPNVVYRGIINKINVVVAGVPDWDVACSTTSGSFTKAAGAGQYLWNVTTIEGKMASLAIVARMPNGERKTEKKEFEIREPEPLTALINGQGCNKCIVQQTLKDLKDGIISIVTNVPIENIRIQSFSLTLPNGNTIEVNGDKLDSIAYNAIKKLKPGDIITIDKIQHYIPGATYYSVKNYTIKIMVVQ